jgi:hypothetical protein
VKQVVGNYSFSAASKTVELTDFSTSMRLDRLLLIVDTVTNKVLYNFAQPGLASATISDDNVFTLSALQGGESNTDPLLIVYDCQTGDPTYDQVPVTLATLIAGEDIPDNRLMVSSECVMSNTNTHNAVSVLPGSDGSTTNAAYSSQINSANYRSYTMAGWGASGNIELLLQISYDGGSTWLWHPNGFTAAGSQYPCQMGQVNAPLCRVAAMNLDESTQDITAYLCLQR